MADPWHCYWPLHRVLSEEAVYPGMQSQVYPPTLLIQRPFRQTPTRVEHSSMSEGYIIQYDKNTKTLHKKEELNGIWKDNCIQIPSCYEVNCVTEFLTSKIGRHWQVEKQREKYSNRPERRIIFGQSFSSVFAIVTQKKNQFSSLHARENFLNRARAVCASTSQVTIARECILNS